jgi:hypothetical protein
MKIFISLVGALVISTATANASAATLSSVVTPLGGGRYEIEVRLNTDLSVPTIVSFDLTFQGEGVLTLVNQLGFGQPQTRSSLANIPDQFDPNYSKATDSWFDDELQPNGSQLGFVVIALTEGPNLLKGGLATDVTVSPPQSFTSGRIAHLYARNFVAGLGGIRVSGSVAVGSAAAQAVNVFIPDLIPAPSEPASGTMTALALVAFTLFRRKRPG